MDVLGATAAAFQVAGLAANVGVKIAKFVNEAKDIVETNNKILIQVDNLHQTVGAVEDVLNRREAQRGKRPMSLDEISAREKTTKTLKQTSVTIDVLREKIEKLGGGDLRAGAWKRGWMQLKSEIQNDIIIETEKQMDRNLRALQLMLPCVQSFMHEETQEVIQTGFECTSRLLNDIQYRMRRLEETIHVQPLSTRKPDEKMAQSSATPEVINAKSGDETLLRSGPASPDIDIASECINFAILLHEKITASRENSIASGQSKAGRSVRTRTLDDLPVARIDGNVRDSLIVSRKNVAGTPIDNTIVASTPSNRSDDERRSDKVEHKPYAPNPDPVVEDPDVLTDHIDNSYRLALEAIKEKDFETAKQNIRDAIFIGEQREIIYRFVFENGAEYREILAYILTQQEDYRKAEIQYYALFKEAKGNLESECRLSFALAKLYRAENRLQHRLDRDDPLFIAWYQSAIHAYNLATQIPYSKPRERLEPDILWKSHPSLEQAAQMTTDMYMCRGMVAQAETYRKRFIGPSESASHATSQPRWSLPINQPPSPAPTDPTSALLPAATRHSYSSEDGAPSQVVDSRIMEQIGDSKYDTVQYILRSEQFVEMEQCNDVGQTLIIIAVVKRNKEIVQSLLDYHPKPNVKAKDNYGRSVLHYALRGYGGDEMVEMLVKSGADVNAPCSEGLPIHFAVINNKPKSLEILAAHNAYLEAKDPGGRTAMVLAVKYQRDDLVQILLEAGAIFDRTLFTDAISKQFIRRLEAYEILPRLEGISINNASRRERTDSVGTAYNLPRVLRRFIKPR